MHFGAVSVESYHECETGFEIHDCSDFIEGSTIFPHEVQMCKQLLPAMNLFSISTVI
jgi:hypothetical protein